MSCYACFSSYSLTLIDALDTLAVMGNYTEFRRVVGLLTATLDFDRDINVSVFETNIRGECFSEVIIKCCVMPEYQSYFTESIHSSLIGASF